MLYELREYMTVSGRRDEFVALMENGIVPFQREMGMDVVGMFVAADDPDRFVWVRRYADDDERRRLTKAVYGSDRWRDDFDTKCRELLDYERMHVTLLHPTLTSALA